MSTFGLFSGGASVLLEATPLVAGTQKYWSDQSGLGVLGEPPGWSLAVTCELPGGETWCLCQLADCRSQRGVWSQGHLDRTHTCFSCGDWDSEEDGSSC